MWVYVCLCVFVCACVRVYVCVVVYLCACVCVLVLGCVCVWVCAYMWLCMSRQVHMYIPAAHFNSHFAYEDETLVIPTVTTASLSPAGLSLAHLPETEWKPVCHQGS